MSGSARRADRGGFPGPAVDLYGRGQPAVGGRDGMTIRLAERPVTDPYRGRAGDQPETPGEFRPVPYGAMLPGQGRWHGVTSPSPALLEDCGQVAKTRAMDPARRWLAVGHSADPDSRQAGREAALRAQDGNDPALLVVFSSGPDPVRMLAGIEEVCPGVPLIGCASQALVASTGPPGPVGGVVVTALGGPGFRVTTGAGSAARGRRRAGAAGASCAVHLPEDAGPHRVLLMFTEGILDHQEEILAGAYSVVG